MFNFMPARQFLCILLILLISFIIWQEWLFWSHAWQSLLFMYEIFLTTHYTYYSFFSCSPTGCSSWNGSGQIISSRWGMPGGNRGRGLHCKIRLATFPSPAGTSLNKLSLGGNTVIRLFPPRETLVSYIAAGDRNVADLLLQCTLQQPGVLTTESHRALT